MSAVTNKLTERRANVWEQAKAVADRAADENRALSAEEQGTWDSLNGELDALDGRIQAYVEQEKRSKDAEEALAAVDGGRTAEGRARLDKGKNTELRSFLRGEPGSPRAFDLKPSGTEFRDLSKLTAGAGADTVPTTFYDQLVAHLVETSAVLQTSPTVLNTTSGETIEVPKTTAHSTAGIIAEAGSITESDPAFDKVNLGAFKYARTIQVSTELLTDSGVDLEGYLARQMGRALGNAFGEDLVVGGGTTEPWGVSTRSTLGATGPTGATASFGSQSAADQGFDLLIELFYSVISPYRASSSCHWMMSDQTAAMVRKLKDADGRYAWQPAVIAGQPDLILGKPVVVDPYVADPAPDAVSILFGDFSQFFVRMAGGVRWERSNDFAFANDLVTFRGIVRVDSDLVDQTGAVKHFVFGPAV